MAREPQTKDESQLKGRVVCFPVCASVEQPCFATLFSPTAVQAPGILVRVSDTPDNWRYDRFFFPTKKV